MSSSDSRGAQAVVQPVRREMRVVLGAPVRVDGRWLCPGKVIGRTSTLPFIGDDPDEEPEEEPTHTLLMVTGAGDSPEAAQRDAEKRLKHMAGSHLPPPPPSIRRA
jgi:hypothetical protein